MRYRAQSADGDYTFGSGLANFLTNSPVAVAQAVQTRLRLIQGEWFLNIEEGTPYQTQVLGTHTKPTYDRAIRTRIIETEGVTELVSYSSTVVDRNLKINATINTAYGQVDLEQVL